jgi:hypothetical protein
MSLSTAAENYVCLLRQLIKWRLTVANLVEYTHTKSSRTLCNSQIKLYGITGAVEYKNKSAYTEISRVHLDFRLIVNSTRQAT